MEQGQQEVITIPDDEDSDSDSDSVLMIGETRGLYTRPSRRLQSSDSDTDVEIIEPHNNAEDSGSETDLFQSSSDETDIDDEPVSRNAAPSDQPVIQQQVREPMLPSGSSFVPGQNFSIAARQLIVPAQSTHVQSVPRLPATTSSAYNYGQVGDSMMPVNNRRFNISQPLTVDPPMSSQLIVNQNRVEITEIPIEVPMEVENIPVNAPVNTAVNESLLDFAVKKDSKKEKEDTSSDDEGQCCIICYEAWTNSGAHRVASLKCGHVFGQSCIEKWLKGNNGKCPQCNAKAKKGDIRVLYVKALKVTDTAERDRALKDLENEKSMRRSAEIKAEQFRLKYQMAIEESKNMKMKMKAYESGIHLNQKSRVHNSTNSKSSSEAVCKYVLQKTIQVSPNGKCRVMTFDSTYDAILVSLPSPQQLFPGFGVKKISAIDNSNAYISIHKNLIRDLCCNTRQDGLLLTASADKTMKITSISSFNTVQTFQSDFQFWACAWNTDDVNYIYGGLQNGSVLVYDTRQANQAVQVLNNNNYSTPMVSLVYVPVGGPSSASGLLMNTLETNGFWEKKEGAEWFCHNLDMDRRCTGMSFEKRTRHLLASYRASDGVRHTRRVMYNFQCQSVGATDTRMVTCTPIETFYGGSTMKQLTRSRLFPSPAGADKLLVCGGDEASGSAHLWDAGSGRLLQKIQVNANVLDVCPFYSNNNHFLATLSDKDLKIFNWRL
ncbi:E3 ubiquitin-protein ligase rfwd3.S-like [Antedon mediterranea]|uniref:E3 ubiquitin-protein ligase rfwd3.S-like n=1 Tax=Antedon mediterranea TaxID=105859 RepID=UPI003AF63483